MVFRDRCGRHDTVWYENGTKMVRILEDDGSIGLYFVPKPYRNRTPIVLYIYYRTFFEPFSNLFRTILFVFIYFRTFFVPFSYLFRTFFAYISLLCHFSTFFVPFSNYYFFYFFFSTFFEPSNFQGIYICLYLYLFFYT